MSPVLVIAALIEYEIACIAVLPTHAKDGSEIDERARGLVSRDTRMRKCPHWMDATAGDEVKAKVDSAYKGSPGMR